MRRVLALLLVLLAVGIGVEEYALGYGRAYVQDRWLGPDPLSEPAAVPAPEGLSLSPVPTPSVVAAAVDLTAVPQKRRVRRAVTPLLGDEDLGERVSVAVEGLDGTPLLRSGVRAFIPASTTKLVTSAAALQVLGGDHTFTTRVVLRGKRLFLVGGGDPFLASRPPKPSDEAYPARADLRTLARSVAEALAARGVGAVRLSYDDSLFSGPAGSAGWEPDYLTDDIVTPISALWVDQGLEDDGWHRADDPAAQAGDVFARHLRKSGIAIRGDVSARAAPGEAEELAVATSAPLDEIVERVLDVSNNEGAEVLLHHVGLVVAGEGSFAAGVASVKSTLKEMGVRTSGLRLWDGSGLARKNRMQAETLLDVLRLGISDDSLRPLITGLPVAGFTGSLTDRFAEAPLGGRGTVRAKTGTLTGVSALAGIATDADGSSMIFVAAADRVAVEDTLDARAALDDLVGALGACACGRAG
ncbi:MAG: D-alanyl-D-alanine carboxypeptidase/D-alanyl-D-alanine-endopeptidase [Nocardioides sp.]|jgi:D-alanyl-D-alanine carboxypeptidase/D-alanyl-D-alanine-endopeptidase (penicillin-binding protein 4)